VARRLNKVETGEVYRVVADQKGVFAQPALMETFGLTIIESMACGLPIVVTCYGGPAEIVIDGECGEIHNPNHREEFADALARIIGDGDLWEKYSQGGIVRAREPYNWEMHTTKLLRLSNIYSYWNYLDVMNRQALDQYIHTLYFTVYRERAQRMLTEH
jgi:sucrose synthase